MELEKGRVKAAKKGETTYQSKKPCKVHGICKRYVSTSACIECQKEASRVKAARVKEQLKAVMNGI